MGIFGPSKQERQQAAEHEARAHEHAAQARTWRAEAAAVRERRQDPVATRGIVADLEANARVQAHNARDEHAIAQQLRKPWWR